MRSSEWVFIPYDWYPYKKQNTGYRHREGHLKTEIRRCLQTKERDLEQILPSKEANSANTFISDFLASKTETIDFCRLSYPVYGNSSEFTQSEELRPKSHSLYSEMLKE